MAIETVFCAFPIFAPSPSQSKRNLDSIRSFIELLKTRPDYLTGEKEVKLDIWFAGYAYNDFFWGQIQSLVKNEIPGAKIFRYDKNYGKSRVVNKLVETYSKANPEVQFLFTMDSDMKFVPEQPLFFERLMLMSQAMQNIIKKPFGFVSLNQLEECCHWMSTHMDRKIEYGIQGESINEEIVFPSSGSGIAGGALFVAIKAWKAVGGYRLLPGVYQGEDGHFSADCQRLGLCVGIPKNLAMIHPKTEGDEEYLKWKSEQMKHAFDPFNADMYSDFMKQGDEIFKKLNEV